MNGMIFAAGLGTRLRPLTNGRPKALVELNGRSLLGRVLARMQECGIDRVVVNVHHFADQIEECLKKYSCRGMEIVVSDERDCLLDTGGGLLKARELFRPGEPVLIHNVDIYSDLDLSDLIRVHAERKAYATLAVRTSSGGRVLKFDDKGVLKGWENLSTGEQKIVDDGFYAASAYSFCGIHIVSPELLRNITGYGVFSIIDEYLAQARCHTLEMYPYQGRFMDLGTPDAIAEAARWEK